MTRFLPGHKPSGVGAINAAKTHCKNGHPFDAENTRIRPAPSPWNGSLRVCRACHRERMRRTRSDPEYIVREKRLRYARKHGVLT